MMPRVYAAQPRDPQLVACIKKYRQTNQAAAWKVFRADADCGRRAVRLLQAAYGPRCIYCDNAHGWTIDHVTAKSAAPEKRFDWANWRPSCMDCNNKKGQRRVVDPVRRDPRAYLVFDLTTGEPIVVAQKRAKPMADATRTLLDNQTLNEARRSVRTQVVEALGQLIRGEPGANAKVRRALGRTTAHRAILRDLILEEDPELNPYRLTVDRALAIMPELATWARSPV